MLLDREGIMDNKKYLRTGQLSILKYVVDRDGRYVLYLCGKRIATVDNYREAIEEDNKLLEV